MQTAKTLEKSVAIEGLLYNPKHYPKEIGREFDPALTEFKRLCRIHRVNVAFSFKDGEFMGTRPLVITAKFTPKGCHA